jgi:hypothetical protein
LTAISKLGTSGAPAVNGPWSRVFDTIAWRRVELSISKLLPSANRLSAFLGDSWNNHVVIFGVKHMPVLICSATVPASAARQIFNPDISRILLACVCYVPI